MSSPLPELPETVEAGAAASPRRGYAGPLIGVLVGMAIILAAGYYEKLLDKDAPWRDAILVPNAPMPAGHDEAFIPVQVRRLSAAPGEYPWLDMLREIPDPDGVLAKLELDKRERVVCLASNTPGLQGLLASGRLPEPGADEALAGDLALEDSFVLDGRTFRVVGRLARSVGSLVYAFVVLDSEKIMPLFTAEAGATEGWIDPEGLKHAAENEHYFDTDPPPPIVGGMTRTAPSVGLAIVMGLIVVAFAGSVFQVRLMRALGESAEGILTPVLRSLLEWPKLLGSMHVLLYGVMFVCMALAFMLPVANVHLASLVRDEFASGQLSYIGKAYESGNIIKAAEATFQQNYLVATLMMTFAPSLIIPFFGLFKNLVSFAVAGFVMAPQWTEAARDLSYHSITMTLEMEAYIVASFAVVLFPVYVVRAAFRGEEGAFGRGLSIMGSGAILTGLMLFVAALYEAATLILFR